MNEKINGNVARFWNGCIQKLIFFVAVGEYLRMIVDVSKTAFRRPPALELILQQRRYLITSRCDYRILHRPCARSPILLPTR